jgi:pimeloyl-ACP methyl ester carboxylesterase
MTSLTEAWRERGAFYPIFGHRVFCVTAGPPDAEPLLLLHGFPTSSLDFHLALPGLAERYRVIVHDHLGFGLSDKPSGYTYSLIEQAEVALALWRSLGVSRGHLLAHDYGTSVATEILARRERGGLPIELSSLSLCNGSVHIELARLTPAQRLLRSSRLGPIFARVSNQAVFNLQIRRILGDPGAVSQAELDAMWEGVERDGGRARLPAISSYLDERVRFRSRWIGALTRLDLPTHILWARRDPVAVPAIAEMLAGEIPGAELSWLEDLGHYPMLEDPDRWTLAARAFLDAGGAPRAGA